MMIATGKMDDVTALFMDYLTPEMVKVRDILYHLYITMPKKCKRKTFVMLDVGEGRFSMRRRIFVFHGVTRKVLVTDASWN